MKRPPPRTPPARRASPAGDAAPPAPAIGPAGLEAAWLTPAAWSAIALATLALAIVAIAYHPIGDYFTESDFFDYAAGGRAIAHGRIAFERYGVIGPVYELALAFATWLHLPLLGFAKGLSIAAAAGVLVGWFVVARHQLGAASGLWAVLVLATNPVFFRYGYSTTTDMLALGLQGGSVALLVAAGGARRSAGAGALAALATLTRYNAAAIVPAALLHLLVLDRRPAALRRHAAIAYLAGFLALAVPWTALSVANGHVPGEGLVRNAAFFSASTGAERNVQDRLVDEGAARSPAATAAASPLARLTMNAPDHLREDAKRLLGWPVAALVLLGVLSLALPGALRAWLPAGLPGLFAFAALVPIFYSDRYSLAVLPVYATLAGLALGARGAARWTIVRGAPLLWLVALVPLGFALRDNVALQRLVRTQLPFDTVESGKALAAVSRPTDGVISRKGAIAYFAGRRIVAFPNVRTLAELADYARAADAQYLYVSWYEALLRPAFWWMLDRTTGTPGLEPVYVAKAHPAVLYRIGPGFGADPAWLADSAQVRLAIARAQVNVLENERCAGAHMVLGLDAREHGRLDEAIAHLQIVTRVRPAEAQPWYELGRSLLDAGRLDEARTAFERSAALAPRNAAVRMGLGRVQFLGGDLRGAAETWRPVLDVLPDSATLVNMIWLYDRLKDDAALATIRRTLEAGGALRPAR